jgi:hypothetical protein
VVKGFGRGRELHPPTLRLDRKRERAYDGFGSRGRTFSMQLVVSGVVGSGSGAPGLRYPQFSRILKVITGSLQSAPANGSRL